MNAKQLREIAETMRDCGIMHIKTADLEISRQPPDQKAVLPVVSQETAPLPVTPQADNPAPPTEGDPDIIEHKIEALTSLMKLSDVELVDQLFPEPREPQEESA